MALLSIVAVGVVVRAVFASTIAFPIPEDTAYYVSVARNLVDGRGLVSDALWSYVTPPLAFPRPAFEIWLPLPTLMMAPLLAILGTASRGEILVPVAAGAVVIALAYALAASVAFDLRLSPVRAGFLRLGTATTAAVAMPLVLHSGLADSTMVFAALALAALLLMAWMDRSARFTLRRDLIALGVLLGLAGLTRNEAIWVAGIWVALVAVRRDLGAGERVRAVSLPGLVAGAIYLPWAVRDWLTFGSPFPGQALLNALSVTGNDIFAYADPPTLTRYLAQGPVALLGTRVDGFIHNLFTVIVLPLFPVSVIGLLALPWAIRKSRSLRPLAVFSLVTFSVTTVVFPVSTTWGTFLHAAGPIYVLLDISCLIALDAAVSRLAEIRRWTHEMAWIGPGFAVACSILMLVPLTAISAESQTVARRYETLRPILTEVLGAAPNQASAPVIADFPILYAAAYRARALALPDESPISVVRLAHRFGASYLLMAPEPRGRWPAILSSGTIDSYCFQSIPIPTPKDALAAQAVAGMRLWRIVCP